MSAPEAQPLLPRTNNGFDRKGFLRHVTVEPILVLYYITNGFYTVTDQALIYEKSCLRLYDQDTCAHISDENFTSQLTAVQKTASQWIWYLDLCRDIPVLLIIAAHGCWSDRFGRRLPLVLALVGEFLASAAKLYNCIYMEIDIAWLMLPFLLHGVFGYTRAILVSAFSYLSEVSSKESRVTRVVIAEATVYLSGGVAMMVSGITLDSTSFKFMYSFCIIVLSVVLVYVFIRLPDIIPEQCGDRNSGNVSRECTERCYNSVSNSCAVPERSGGGSDSGLGTDVKKNPDLSSISTTSDTPNQKWSDMVHVVVFLKKRTGNRRAYIVLTTMCVGLIVLCDPSGINYLYLKKVLSWSQTTFGFYSGYATLVRGLGLMLIVPILKKVLFVLDTTLMISGAMSKIAAGLVMAFAASSWIPFLRPIVGIIELAPIPAVRGFISTLIEPWEQGKLFALVGTVEGLGYLASSSLYNYFLYPKTLDIYPGFCFLFSSVLCLVPLAVFIGLHMNVKRRGTPLQVMEDQTVISSADTMDSSATSPTQMGGSTAEGSSSGSHIQQSVKAESLLEQRAETNI